MCIHVHRCVLWYSWEAWECLTGMVSPSTMWNFPEDWSQVIKVRGRHPYPLHHLLVLGVFLELCSWASSKFSASLTPERGKLKESFGKDLGEKRDMNPVLYSRVGVRWRGSDWQEEWRTLLAPPEGHHYQSWTFHPGQMREQKWKNSTVWVITQPLFREKRRFMELGAEGSRKCSNPFGHLALCRHTPFPAHFCKDHALLQNVAVRDFFSHNRLLPRYSCWWFV